MNRSLIQQTIRDAIASHNQKTELVMMEALRTVTEALDENKITFVNITRIAKECTFNVYPNGDKVFYHLNKPLVLFKALRMEEKTEGDKTTFEMVQEYKKLY